MPASGTSQSSIYPVLKTLRKDGLVEKCESEGYGSAYVLTETVQEYREWVMDRRDLIREPRFVCSPFRVLTRVWEYVDFVPATFRPFHRSTSTSANFTVWMIDLNIDYILPIPPSDNIFSDE